MDQSSNDTFHLIVEKLNKGTSFIIISHENPDGDSLGAQFALAIGLISLGKEVHVFCKNPIPNLYEFLPTPENIIISERVYIKNQTLIVLDCGDLERSGITFIPEKPPLVLNIDHHISNTNFGHINWIDPLASATAEMIFHFFHLLPMQLNPQIATNLYTGILTDTGSFQHSNTTSVSLKIAAQLIEAGADPHSISISIYDRKSISALRLMGIVLNEMKLYNRQRVAILTVTRAILEKIEASYEDTEELVTLPQKIANIEASILIKEINPSEYKVSFRTKNRINASLLAQELGGGGHPNAAGAKIKGGLEEVTDKILCLTEKYLNKISG